MYNHFVFCFLLFLFNGILLTSLSAQPTFLEFKVEQADGSFYFGLPNYEELEVTSSKSNQQGHSIDFSLGLTAPVYNDIYLNSAIGTNDFSALIQTVYPPNEKELYGNLHLQQIFIEVLPEWRFFEQDWLFVNAGVGLHKITESRYSDDFRMAYFNRGNTGIDIKQGNYTLDKDEFPRFTGSTFSFAANIGGRYTFNNIGITGSFGYRQSTLYKTESSKSTSSIGSPLGVGFKHLTYKIGLTYKIKDGEEAGNKVKSSQ